jgi:hypothetical protein
MESVRAYAGTIYLCTACGQPCYDEAIEDEYPALVHFKEQWDGIHCSIFPLAVDRIEVKWDALSLKEQVPPPRVPDRNPIGAGPLRPREDRVRRPRRPAADTGRVRDRRGRTTSGVDSARQVGRWAAGRWSPGRRLRRYRPLRRRTTAAATSSPVMPSIHEQPSAGFLPFTRCPLTYLPSLRR